MNSIKQDIVKRVRIIYVLLLFFALLIVGRICFVQFVDGKKWKGRITKITMQERTISAARGNIYSSNGSLLATSLPQYRVGFDLTVAGKSKKNTKIFETKLDSMCLQLAIVLKDRPAQYFKSKIMEAKYNKRSYITLIDRDISFQEKKKIEDIVMIKEGKYKSGVVFEQLNKRTMPFDKMGLRTIGYFKNDGKKIIGVGLENSMNNYLQGINGRGLFQQLSGNSWKPVEDAPETRPKPGLDVYTTLDVNIQDVAETALKNAVNTYSPNYATVVVMEVKTGEIKAMANLGFDKGSNTYNEHFNFAVALSTTPGSTIKLPTMLALLEEGVKPTDIINTGDGVITYHGKELHDAKRGGHGTINVQQIFEKSSNIGVVKLVLNKFQNKEQKYFDYLHKFRLDQQLGFQIVGEPIPKFHPPRSKGHSALSLPWTAFGGYEASVTPLQMLTLYNAVANDGYWVQPIIVKHIKDANKIEVDFTESQVKIQEPIASKNTIAQVKKMMEGVVDHGTAARMKSSQYTFAGKTGTSRKNVRNGFKTKGVYYTAFTGYFPAKNPKYSIMVVIDEPKGQDAEKLHAADVCAPVFREIADHIFADDLSLHQPKKINNTAKIVPTIQAIDEDLSVINKKLESHINTEKVASVKSLAAGIGNRSASNEKMPNLIGLPLRDALYILENKNFKVTYQGIGKVKSQSIAPGTLILNNNKIQLQLM
jgi:cell division protein FtsI (penicillin-binding protein 3)